MTRAGALLVVVVCIGCTPEIPDATYVCTETSECPPGLVCDTTRSLCVREARLPDAGCMPLTCELVRAECGTLDDGCGGTLSCGTCTAPETCGGDGSPNICGCTPRECDPLDCEVRDNGCGALMDCGACDAPLLCGIEEPNRCACETDDPCEADPKSCGEQVDECGIVHTCAVCEAGEVCGGGGENRCGTGTCMPRTCASVGANCGTISDGCGVTLNCGSCAAPQSCGGGPAGGGTANQCGCTPRTCATTELIECGIGAEECGMTLDCGSCPSGSSCNANRCECTPLREPNDTPRTATALTVSDGYNVWLGEHNVHAAGDEDFFSVAPVGTVFADERVTLEVRVPGTLDVGIWVQCTDSPASDIVCSLPSSMDPTYLEGGCVSLRSTSPTTVLTLGAACGGASFLVRVSGAPSCTPYDLAMFYTP